MAARGPNISNVPLTSARRVVLRGPGATELALTVNGEAVTVQVPPRRTLLDTLREPERRFATSSSSRSTRRSSSGLSSTVMQPSWLAWCWISGFIDP